MLTLRPNPNGADSPLLRRRGFLQAGFCGVGGFSLAQLLRLKSAVADSGRHVRTRSIILLNCQGGATQFETFDPKMSAPAEIRSITGEVSTSLPGVTFGGSLPGIAQCAHQMAVVRSYRHGISSHGPAAMHVMAGGNATGAMMGALYSRVAGLTNPETGLPRNIVVTSQCIDQEHGKLYRNTDRVSKNGTLPPAYRPFDPSAGGEILENMTLQLAADRMQDRRGLLQSLDGLRRRVDSSGLLQASDQFQQQAFDVLARGVSDAFDLRAESPETLAAYDTSDCGPTAGVQRRNSYAAQFSPTALGHQLLLARRLCEAGCGFVTVTCPGWDMHGGGKEFRMDDGIATLTPALDRAVSALIRDIQQRGLSDEILLMITGEFGRTPRINANGGRDHWGNLCPLVFVGGGLKMGQVIGESDRIGGEPATTPISSSNVLATVMHSLFDIPEFRLVTGIPKDVERVITSGAPIPALIQGGYG